MAMKHKKMSGLKEAAGSLRERLADEGGFSIVELLVASILLFVLTFATINFADQGTAVTGGSMARAEVNQELRETLEAVTRQIRVAYFFVPAQCTPTSLGFYSYATGDAAGTKYNIRFRLNGTALETSRDGGVNWTIMASGVTSLAFTLRDSDGNTTTDTSRVALVNVAMGVSRSFSSTAGTQSEGHRLEYGTQTAYTQGEMSVAIRNVLTTGP